MSLYLMKRNVLLITLDSARKDFYDEVSHVREKADIKYENCRAASCWSVPSHASMMTGKLPSEHGKHAYNYDMNLQDYETVCDLWEGNTFGISSNVYASSAYNFDINFGDFIDIPRHQPFSKGLNATEFRKYTGFRRYTKFLSESLTSGNPIRSLLNGFSAQLKKSLMGTPIPEPIDDGAILSLRLLKKAVRSSDDPVFGFLNLMETHEPYSYFWGLNPSMVDKKAWSSLNLDRWDFIFKNCSQEDIALSRQYHRAMIEYVTRKISKLADELDDTTIIVTSDHGENMGYAEEDELWGHTSSLSDALCHVPLDILNAPGAQSVEPQLVSHLDLKEMIIAFGEGRIQKLSRDSAQAETLGMAAGAEPPEDEEFWNRPRRAVWRKDEKVIWDTESPPSEAEAWATEQFNQDIYEAKSAARRNSGEGIDIDESTKSHLEELGYR